MEKRPVNLDGDILKKSLAYSLSLYIRMFVQLLSGLIIAKLLGPALYGLRNAFSLFQGYEVNTDLGTFPALNRKVPFYRGENNQESETAAVNSVFTVNMTYAAIAAIALFAVSQYIRLKGYEQKYVDFALFFGVILFTGKLKMFLQTRLKIDKRFYVLSTSEIAYGLATAAGGIVLVYLYGFRGLLVSLLVADLLIIGYIFSKDKRLPRIEISAPIYWQILKIGFPMMILMLLLLLLNSADRTLILAYLSPEALGYYAIALVATNIIATIPVAVHNVTLAPAMEKLGRLRQNQSIRNYYIDPAVMIAYSIPILIVGLYYLIHLPIEYYLDKYLRSIVILKIMIVGAYFNAVASPALSISLAFNKQVMLVLIVTPLVMINIGLNVFLLKMGWDLEGVAIGTSVTYFIYFVVLNYYAAIQLGDSIKQYLSMLGLLLTPAVYATVLVVLIDYGFTFEGDGLWSDVCASSLKCGIFIALYSLVFLRIKKQPAFKKLLENIRIVQFIQKRLKPFSPR